MGGGADEEEKNEDGGNGDVNAFGWEAAGELVPWEIRSACGSTAAAAAARRLYRRRQYVYLWKFLR